MSQTRTILQQRYEIVRLIAEGGMGAVYEGRDLKFGGSPVAVKRCLLTGELMQRAFVREANLMANLSHPGMPKVRDHFAEPDGHYLVMEYIPGSDLEEILKERGEAITAEEALGWMDQVLDALSYMHSRQPPVIHRDIKPGNIKLTPRGHVMLIDFGLAKGNGTSSLSGYSVNYAPLEQFQDGGTDGRSDLYSLGATMYRLMTGQLPVSALNRVSAMAKGHQDPLPRLHEVNNEVPETVSEVVWGAMALDREDRLPNAMVMRERLRKAMESQSEKLWEKGYTPTLVSSGALPAATYFEKANGESRQPYTPTAIDTGNARTLGDARHQAEVKVNKSLEEIAENREEVADLMTNISEPAFLINDRGKSKWIRPTLIALGITVALILGLAFIMQSTGEPASSTQVEQIFAVDAREPWLDTDIDIEPGMLFDVAAEGTIWLNTQDSVGPDGKEMTGNNTSFPLSSAGAGALIVTVRYPNGYDLDYLAIGSKKEIGIANYKPISPKYAQSGKLMLGINDYSFSDNQGSFRVRIRRLR